MGRIFEKRKERMFARWSKNAKAFTKIGKEIAIAVKLGGTDPSGNPRLRMAIQTARTLNMPKDRIEAAVHRAASKDSADMEEITYEAYAPHGVALIIEAASDNRTRTVGNVRSNINRFGGSLASSGALDFVFHRKGVFSVVAPSGGTDELELNLIDHGLEEIFETEDGLLLYCGFSEFGEIAKELEAARVEVKSASLQRVPLSFVEVSPEQEEEVERLIAVLEEDDDVQHVYSNLKSSESLS